MSEILAQPQSPQQAVNNPTLPFIDTGFSSTAFVILSSALVFIITPGMGLFYSGMSKSKNASMSLILTMLSYCMVSIQWFLFGFSLTFSEGGSPVIGNFVWAAFKGVGSQSMMFTQSQVPLIAFALYQAQFAALAMAGLWGSVCERARILPAILFMWIWTTFVYDPVAYWTWGAHGWIKNMSCLNNLSKQFYVPCGIGAIDNGGAGPVFIASGFSSLAYAIVIRKSTPAKYARPHNVSLVFLGTALIWFGFFGFNGASSVEASPRAAMSAYVTTVSSSAGAITWLIMDLLQNKKFSGTGFCCGAVAGLIGISAGSGHVAPWASFIIGIITSFICNFCTKLTESYGLESVLYSFTLNGIGGFTGFILAGIFAQRWLGNLDGIYYFGGAIDNNVKQISYQIGGAIAIAAWSFLISFIVLFAMSFVPGLSLTLSEDDEKAGGDYTELGEATYDIELLFESHKDSVNQKAQ